MIPGVGSQPLDPGLKRFETNAKALHDGKNLYLKFICRSDDMATLKAIEPSGQIKICGTNAMAGYLNADGTVAQYTNGEYLSGDIGYIDEDGFLYVQGRVDDLIVFSDGTKVMPQSIEAELAKIDGVKESVVFADGDKLKVVVVVVDGSQSQRVESEIALNTYLGYKFSQITVTQSPLEKNALGKLNRCAYGQK